MTPEARKFRATDAKQLLENPLFVEAFGALKNHLNMQALSCDPDNAAKAQRIVLSQQLLAGLEREITRIVQDGTIAEIQMNEIEKRNRLAFFKR
jgi:hypothetical protein